MYHVVFFLVFVGLQRGESFGTSLSTKGVDELRNELVKMSAASESNPPPLRKHAPRKICLFVEPTPFTYISGYFNRFNEMLKYLAEAGDEVNILTTDPNTAEEHLPKEKFGHKIYHTKGFKWPLYESVGLSFDVPDMKGLKIIEKTRPDLIHASSPGFLLYAALLYARVKRIPLILSYHTHLPVHGRHYFGFIPGIEEFSWSLIRFVHTRADLTLVTSPQIKEEMLDHGISQVDVWRKGIDAVRFNPKFKDQEMRERMSNGNPDDFLMVYVGRLGPEKRLKDIKGILHKMPNARLCIVGEGPEGDELKRYFMGTKTVFTGQLSGEELSKAFASGDVFVMPSDSETLGFVVLESMASGVPVVGARAGGIPDMIANGETGFLVPPGDIDSFVSCLTKLQEDEFRVLMGENARMEASKWSWESSMSILRNLQYERAISNFRRSRAFGGFGRPGTRGIWRLLRSRVAHILAKLRIPGFRRPDFASKLKSFLAT